MEEKPGEAAQRPKETVKQTPLRAGVQAGLGFAVLWGLAMWFLQWRGNTSPLVAVVTAALAGVLFGLAMTWLTRRSQRKEHS
jgi:membrane associated rhomboid family serine protease